MILTDGIMPGDDSPLNVSCHIELGIGIGLFSRQDFIVVNISSDISRHPVKRIFNIRYFIITQRLPVFVNFYLLPVHREDSHLL